MDGWITGYQVHHLQLVAPDHREQLFHPNVEPAGALNTASGCQSGRGCMINIRYTCVLLGLVPALPDGPLADRRTRQNAERRFSVAGRHSSVRVCFFLLTCYLSLPLTTSLLGFRAKASVG